MTKNEALLIARVNAESTREDGDLYTDTFTLDDGSTMHIQQLRATCEGKVFDSWVYKIGNSIAVAL